MTLLSLAFRSLFNRKFTTGLTILSIALSTALLLSVEKIRTGAQDSFATTISKTDLIIGARTGAIQLLLYSVFHMGDATNNIRYSTYEAFKKNPKVDWTIPISLGDSHKGYKVVATNEDFFKRYHYRQDHELEFLNGKYSGELWDVVVGSEVAENLHYSVGSPLTLTHGSSDATGFSDHSNKPFTVSGILKRTATPLDRSLYISLEAMEAIHVDWQNGAPPLMGMETPKEKIKKQDLHVNQLTAFFVGTKSRVQSIYLEREANEFAGEPLLGIIPGVALSQLWQAISYAEDALRIVSLFVVVSGLLGMLIALYTSLNERRREMAILRAVGAGPFKIVFLMVTESTLLTFLGVIIGTFGVYLFLGLIQPWLEKQFGVFVPIKMLSSTEWIYLGIIQVAGIVLGLIPAYRAFKNTLQDGLTIRV